MHTIFTTALALLALLGPEALEVYHANSHSHRLCLEHGLWEEAPQEAKGQLGIDLAASPDSSSEIDRAPSSTLDHEHCETMFARTEFTLSHKVGSFVYTTLLFLANPSPTTNQTSTNDIFMFAPKSSPPVA